MNDDTEIKILEIFVEGVTYKKIHEHLELTPCTVPLRLSGPPSNTWAEFFMEAWNKPPSDSMEERPGIPEVNGAMICLKETTIDNVENSYKIGLLRCVQKANEKEKEYQKRGKKFREYIKDRTNEIKF